MKTATLTAALLLAATVALAQPHAPTTVEPGSKGPLPEQQESNYQIV